MNNGPLADSVRSPQRVASGPIRTLIVDDAPSVVRALVNFLRDEEHITVVGYANDGYEALEKIEELKPDLVLMDFQMPRLNGLEVTRRIRKRDCTPRIVILTLHDTRTLREASFVSGADGFVNKSQIATRLIRVIDGIYCTMTSPGAEGR